MRTSFACIAGAAAILAAACNDSQLTTAPPAPDQPVAVITSAASGYGTLENATLDGSGSYDPDNSASDAIVEYRWALTTAPAGSSSALVGASSSVNLFVDVAGTYTITLVVVDQDGLESDPAEFTLEGIPFDDIHVELSWDIDVSDVDLHLVAEGGSLFHQTLDCYFGNCMTGLEWGVAGPAGNPTLDLDDVQGYGPENVNIEAPTDGTTYKVSVHYWSDDGLGSTTATIRIYLSGQLQFEAAQSLNATGRTWDVATIAWPSGTVTALGQLYNCDPNTVVFGGTC